MLNRGERAEWREARVYEDKTRGPHYKETQYTLRHTFLPTHRPTDHQEAQRVAGQHAGF